MTVGRAALVAGLGLLALTWVGCGDANAGRSTQDVGPDDNLPRIAHVVDGFPFWIENGAEIDLGPELTAVIRVGPYPPTRDGVLEIVLQNPADQTPVVGATVEASAEMRYMDHGVLRLVGMERTGAAAAPGHYRIPLRFVMAGEWQVHMRVIGAELRADFDLLLIVTS
jgi:hypothetical protein